MISEAIALTLMVSAAAEGMGSMEDGEAVEGTVAAMPIAAVGVTTVGRMATWLGIVPGRGVALVAAGLVITAASLGIWQEIAIAAVAAAEPLVVVVGVRAITVGGKGTWLGSALVEEVEAEVAVVMEGSEVEAAAAAEATATTVGSKGTSLRNALTPQGLDNSW